MTLRTVTYDTATHKIVPREATEEMIIAGDDHVDGLTILHDCYEAMIEAAPEYQEPDIRAKLAINMIKYLGATKTQAKAIIDGVFDGEHTINESDLKYQEPTKDE